MPDDKKLMQMSKMVDTIKPVNYTAKLIDLLFKGKSPTAIAEQLSLTIGEVYDILQNPMFSDIMHNIVVSLLPSLENKVVSSMHKIMDSIEQDILSSDIPIKNKIQASSLYFNVFAKLLDMSAKSAEKRVPKPDKENALDKLLKIVEMSANTQTADIVEDLDDTIIDADEGILE